MKKRLEYKLKENSIDQFSLNYLEDYLKSIGIKETESFMTAPRLEDQEDYRRLDNIEEMAEMLHEGFESGSKFFLQVDSDADGYTSSAIFYAFFKELYPDANIEWRIHENKEHGIIVDTIPMDTDYVIIPDAGASQVEEQIEMSTLGYRVLIMDHHRMDNVPEIDNVLIVNNQSSDRFQNKALSGAGVVYKVIQCFNHMYEDQFPLIFEKFADLAALGIVADMMDTRELDNNYIIQKGLSNVQNPMFRAILERQSYSIKDIDKPNKIDLAFYVAPLINAVIRFGTAEEKDEMMMGFVTYDPGMIKETEYRGAPRKENFHDYVSRIATNVRARQNRDKDKSMGFLSNRVEEGGLHENQLLVVKTSKEDKVGVHKSITGLVAMELLKKYNRPTLVLRPRSDGEGGIEYAGSGRGRRNGHFQSLFQMLEDSGLCTFVAGHDMAHGVGITEENLPKVIDYANEHLSDIEFDVDQVEVDYIFRNGNLNYDMLEQFGEATHLYGHMIPQPRFAFDLRVAKTSIFIMGKRRDTFKINLNGIDFIKFRSADIVKILEDENAHIFEFKFVGRAQINEWNGRTNPQIMIDQLVVEPIQLESLF